MLGLLLFKPIYLLNATLNMVPEMVEESFELVVGPHSVRHILAIASSFASFVACESTDLPHWYVLAQHSIPSIVKYIT